MGEAANVNIPAIHRRSEDSPIDVRADGVEDSVLAVREAVARHENGLKETLEKAKEAKDKSMSSYIDTWLGYV